MIKNQRQYSIASAQAARFESALEAFDAAPEATDVDPILRKAERDAMASQLEELQVELQAYEKLLSGEEGIFELTSLAGLPDALVRARIAAGLTHKELAERLGLKEQQIQRYEASNYSGASLDRIQMIAEALGITIRKEILLPTKKLSPAAIVQTLNKVGIDRDLMQRLVAPAFHSGMGRKTMGAALTSVSEILSAVERVFGIPAAAIAGESPLRLSAAAVGGVRYKAPARVNAERFTAFTVYAHYLALLALQATEGLEKREIPTDPEQVRREVVEQFGHFTFRSALEYVWGLGVVVLPLRGAGAFHGACWREDGRNVLVLKQTTASESRWLYDLLHELRHAAEQPDREQFTVIEQAVGDTQWDEAPEEVEAMEFAGEVILDGRADDLAELAVKEAGGAVERLSRAVPRVAQREGVLTGALANHIAFRLAAENDINWWGAATNLQEKGGDPFEIARDVLLDRLKLERLSAPDRDLLMRGLTDLEEVSDVQSESE
jgi:transcriptional regulator with XRE-family HTH domain